MKDLLTIKDYILWRGDLSFEQAPFQLVDSFVLCELSYVNYQTAGLLSEKMTLKEAGERILNQNTYELRNLFGGQQDFFEAAVASKRFGNIVLRDYVDSFDPSSQLQFSAITFDLSEKESFIAYRGTDDSLTGWKEDFMLSFTKIPSHAYAMEYLQKQMCDERMYRIGGHSKGGNLALYALSNLPETNRKRIIQVYDLDGPGFCEDVYDISSIQWASDKIIQVTPEFSFIGNLYPIELGERYVIHSSASGLNQHDLIHWNLKGPQPELMEAYDKVSVWLIGAVNEWANHTPIEQRKQFVNELFDALYASGVEHFSQINLKNITKVIQAISQSDQSAKKIALDLAKTAIGLNERKQEKEI